MGWIPWLFCLAVSGAATADPILGSILELVDSQGRRIPRLEASGIAYFNGNLLVVDDTLNSLFVFDPTGRLAYTIESERFPRPRAKFEDLAFDPSAGRFLVVGSHEGWDRESLESVSVLLRFRLVEKDGKLFVEEESLDRLPLYRSFERLGLWRPNGMKIEGLAYDPVRDHLYVGLREPKDRARIYRLVAQQLQGDGPNGEPPLPVEVVSFDAGQVEGTPFCISALLWVPTHRGLLMATSTEDDATHAFLGNRLWFFSESSGVSLLRDTFDRGMKAEGLAVGDGQLFISYDNDQDDTSIPSRLRRVPLESVLRDLR